MNANQRKTIEAVINDSRYNDEYVGNFIRANWRTPLGSGIGDELDSARPTVSCPRCSWEFLV
jgi:hypothetical protein